jgi:hypothetical protein
MKSKVLFLDLDRTLFDTVSFMTTLWRALSDHYGQDYDHCMALVPQYYRAIGDYRYYDLKIHLQDGLGVDPEEAVAAVTPQLKNTDFTFPDASELHIWQKSDYEIRILTFGPAWVQQFKMRFAPSIAHLPIDIILEPKNEFIAREYADRNGLLVDDKRGLHLPPNFKEVWIDREHTMQNAQEYGIIYINSLTQVKELL